MGLFSFRFVFWEQSLTFYKRTRGRLIDVALSPVVIVNVNAAEGC
ncbi:hypothetical protein CPTD_01259 [Corynebacterium pseudotuberculosis]|nr:hypothetical protein CPTD_01259 [Corynebacterium pseudotuberculosis]